jgi:hypothetical protein
MDFLATLGGWDHDSPIHVELVAKGVNSPAEGLNKVVRGLSRVGYGKVSATSDGDACLIHLEIGDVTVHVVIKADAERIEDNSVCKMTE